MNEMNSPEPIAKFADGALSKTQHASDAANAFLKSSVDSVVQTTQQLRDSAQHATDRTTLYIRDEPIKSVLIAAATGAVLMGLIGMMRRSPHRA